MYPENPSRRNVLKTVAASGTLLGTGITATGSVAAQSGDLENHLLIYGNGTVTEYFFQVPGHGTVEKTTDPGDTGIDPSIVTLNGTDEIQLTNQSWEGPMTTVRGRTTNQADAYRFTGSLDFFSASKGTDHFNPFHPALVFLNGELRDPRYVTREALYPNFVLFYGNGTPGTYEFTVNRGSRWVAKATYSMEAPVGPDTVTINPSDTISEERSTDSIDGLKTVVSGRTTNEADAYTFHGDVVSIKADPSVVVYFPELPNLSLYQVGCEEREYYDTGTTRMFGVFKIANPSSQWVLVRDFVDLADPRVQYVGPGETKTIVAPSQLSAYHVPSPEALELPINGYYPPARYALINGQDGELFDVSPFC